MINRADILKFNAIKKALLEGRVLLLIDFGLLNHKKSPFFNPWENLIPLLLVTIFSLIMMFSSLLAGILILLAGIIGYLKIFPIVMKDFMKQRVLLFLTKSIEDWDKCWSIKGITLVASDNPRIFCRSCDDNWRDFVVINFADFMVDKKIQKITKEEEKKPLEEKQLPPILNKKVINNPKNKQQPHFTPEDPDFYE